MQTTNMCTVDHNSIQQFTHSVHVQIIRELQNQNSTLLVSVQRTVGAQLGVTRKRDVLEHQ